MGVDSAETESAYGSPARLALLAPLPGLRLLQNAERTFLQFNTLGRLLKVSGRRQSALFHRQQGFHQSGGTGSGQQMSDIRFHRTDHTLSRLPVILAPETFQTGELDHISNRGAGCVAFDHVNIRRRPTGLLISRTHRPQLAFGSRSQQTATDIVGQTDTANHRIDMISGAHSIFGAFEQEHTTALTDHKSVAIGIERGTGSRRRQSVQLREAHLGVERIWTRQSTSQHGIGTAGQQFIDSQLDGIEGGGASSIKGITSAAEAESFSKETCWKAGDVAIQWVDTRQVRLHIFTKDFFSKRTAEILPGHGRGVFTGESQVADDDTDLLPINLVDATITERLVACTQQQAIHRIETA